MQPTLLHPMKDFSADSKVWIYQSDRALTESEVAFVNENAKRFIDAWTTHGKHMKAHILVFYNRFLVLFADESQAEASGCGIDKSVHFFQQLERSLGINLMNRLLVAYKEQDEVKTCSLHAFEKKIESGEITADTIVFNNLVSSKAEFLASWESPLKQSWHSKMLVH